jgi:hypothetical protein
MSNTRRTPAPRTTTTARPRRALAADPAAPDTNLYITYLDERYLVAEKTGIWPLLQFARAAESGGSAIDSRGLAAIHAFLQDVIDPADWGRFQEDMIKKKVTDLDGLMTAAREAVEAVFARQSADEAARRNGTAPEAPPATLTGPAGSVNGTGGHAAQDPGKLRAADRDRDRAAERLAAALADGRLTADEHTTRLEQALAGRTLGELAALLDDLPGPGEE